MIGQVLSDEIRKLSPSGPDGFEGLIAKLLTNLTGRRFYLAQSGSQSGRDMSSERLSGNILAVECKRYGKETELNERELLGELVQAARDVPDLDIWVLVASRSIPSQLIEPLTYEAHEKGIEFYPLSSDDGSPSSLEVLCAQESAITIEHFRINGRDHNLNSLTQFLDTVMASPGFGEAIEKLRSSFLIEIIGYENWRISQNAWFLDHCSSEEKSRTAFKQILNVTDTDVHIIQRQAIWRQLDQWYFDWATTRSLCVLLGEEGDGKTWSVARWLAQRNNADPNFPAVIFLSSLRASSNDPKKLIADAMSYQAENIGAGERPKRLGRWLKRQAINNPLILLVLDGVNERRSPSWWRGLLEALTVDPWNRHVCLIVTCRTVYWQQSFDALRYLQPQVFYITPYDNDELSEALKQHNLTIPDIPRSIFPLIRKPRYFDLVVRFRERMAESGDITPERLVYEDWRDRYERKTHLSLDDRTFQDLILELARKNREGMNFISQMEMGAILSLHEEKQVVLQELVTGGILRNESGRYQVAPQLLQYGFGLLLADEVWHACSDPGVNISEVIASWLEPHPEMDIKSAICSVAVLHALTILGYPNEGHLALLQAWISSQNPPKEVEENFSAYLPLNPNLYMALAEYVWSDVINNHWGQEMILYSLIRWCHLEKVRSVLLTTFEVWLGFVHRDGRTSKHNRSDEKIRESRAAMAERLGYELVPGKIEVAGYPLTVIEDYGLLRLGEVALAVISHMPRKPFIRAIAIGCLSEEVMGFPEKHELFAWTLRSSPSAISDVAIQQAEDMISQGLYIALQAAYRLLSYEGGSEAIKLRSSLPQDLFPPNPFFERHEKDPCSSGFSWQREHVQPCLEREDLEPKWVVRQLKQFCVDPTLSIPERLNAKLESLATGINVAALWTDLNMTEEQFWLDELEPILCASIPKALVPLIQNTVRDGERRKDLPLRQFAFAIGKYLPVFGPEEREHILIYWHSLQDHAASWTEMHEDAEWALFSSVLQIDPNGDNQLKRLLQRHPRSKDLLHFTGLFQPLTRWDVLLTTLEKTQDVKSLQRILWFMSRSVNSVQQGFIPYLSSFLSHPDSWIRTLSMKILYQMGDSSSLESFVHGSWSYSNKYWHQENDWGSLILCHYGSPITYHDLRNRIHPSYLGYAVKQRGVKHDEIKQFASDLFLMWQNTVTGGKNLPTDFPAIDIDRAFIEDITSIELRGISDSEFNKIMTTAGRNAFWSGKSVDFPKFENIFSEETYRKRQDTLRKIVEEAIHEQWEAGNELFARSFPIDGLEDAINQRPDLFDTMIETAIAEKPNTSRVLVLCQGFYETLCRVLLNNGRSEGFAIYKKLINTAHIRFVQTDTDIRWLNYWLFAAPENVEATTEWDNQMNQCTTDQELMELVLVAISGNGRSWLRSRVDAGLSSTVQWERARSITILGFMDVEDAGQILQRGSISVPNTWLATVAKKASHYYQMNTWAKAWFIRFLSDENDIRSWAAFRLFLECVDRRYYFWKQEIIRNSKIIQGEYDRLMFLESQESNIRNKVKKNEKSLQESFLSQKILKHYGMWPWM